MTFIDDATTIESDFRHTIALAILMARSGMHRTHQAYYLELLLENPCKDGGWPKVIGRQVSDLPATAYVVEYLATWSKHSPPSLLPRIGEAIRGGQDWLILAARSDGGWSTGIFSTPWDGLWSTAYILPRLLASALPAFPEWSQALLEATIAVLRDACEMEYKNDREEFRIEARVAAALAAALRTLGLDDLFRGRVENWLERWESRFLETLTHLSAKECDLATSTFAAAALLRNRNPADVGKQSLSEL